MEKEYIEKYDLINNLKKFAPEHYTGLIDMLIQKQRPVDVTEVKHGKWIIVENYADSFEERPVCISVDDRAYKCSCCSSIFWSSEWTNRDLRRFLCCPHCGAIMDMQKFKKQNHFSK